jgi:hypothetical protein
VTGARLPDVASLGFMNIRTGAMRPFDVLQPRTGLIRRMGLLGWRSRRINSGGQY